MFKSPFGGYRGPNKKKEPLLAVAKNYVQLKDDTDRISIEEYNKEIDEAMARIDAGEFHTHEKVVP